LVQLIIVYNQGATMRKVIFLTTVFSLCAFAPGVALADYPPIPSGLGKRVETPVPAPAAIGEAAAVVVKPESVAVVIEPRANMRSVTIRVINQVTGRVTTRTITVAPNAEFVAPQVSVPAGKYRVQIIGTLKSGNEVKWNAGVQNVKKKR
jgi:hypothetical protein